MAKPPKWIARDARKVRLSGPEGEIARHRAQQEHLEAISAAADVSSAKRATRVLSPGEFYNRPKLMAAVLGVTSRELAEVDLGELIPRELARLADGKAQLWTCSIRAELLARHLIEITEREDGRWAGDRITMKGERFLRAATGGSRS